MAVIWNNNQPKTHLIQSQGEKIDIDALNNAYRDLSYEERLARFYQEEWVTHPDQVLFTSSFGVTSGILLNMISRVRPRQKIYFLNTGYHFEETLQYKEVLKKQLQLKVIDLFPEGYKHQYSRKEQLWLKNPDFCCSINKVEPLEPVKKAADFWISGLMHWQNQNRSNLNIFEVKEGILKFYPLLDMPEEEAYRYLQRHDIPEHPLHDQGYESIGCTHCTFKGKGRQGRWPSQTKTECGLHA